MNKRLALMFLLAGTLFFCTAGKSQKLFFVYANGMYNKPTGSFKSSDYNYGLGGELGGGIGLLGKTFLTGSVAYNSFNNTEKGVSNLKVTPVKFGIRQYLFAKMLFAKIDAGVASVKGDGDSQSKFTAGAGVGAKFVGLNVGIDYNTVHLGQEGANWIGWFAFKVGYSFGF